MDRLKQSWTRPLLCALLFAAIFAAFWPVLHDGYINYDDPPYIFSNPHVATGLNWANVAWAFRTGEAANWHPLTWLSHMLDVQLFGLNPGAHHLTNLLFHAANTLLLFLLLDRMTRSLWPSAWVAAIFALHPLHVESVAWLAERKDVLSTFFFLLTLMCYAQYASRNQNAGEEKPEIQESEKAVKKPAPSSDFGPWTLDFGLSLRFHASRFYALSLLFFALGLMSKPMLVTTPFVLLLLDYWPLRRFEIGNQKSKIKNLLLEKLPFFALAAAASTVTFLVQRHAGAVAQTLPLLARAENALVAYLRYLGKTFWPVDLCILYPHPTIWPAMLVLASGAVLAVISVAVLVFGQRRSWIPVGWFWFVGTLVPVIGLVQVGSQSMADRYTYIPMIGLLLVIAWEVQDLAPQFSRLTHLAAVAQAKADHASVFPPFFCALGLAAIVLCLGLTRHQLGYWKDSETVFRHAIAVTTNNSFAHGGLASALADEGRIDEAIPEYREAIRLWPDDTVAYNRLGNLLGAKGRIDEALAMYEEDLSRHPNDAFGHSNLGLMLVMKGRLDQAILHFRQAVRVAPGNADFQNNLGAVLARKGLLDEAIEHYREAIRIAPSLAKAHQALGVSLCRKTLYDEGIAQFHEAIRLQPDFPEAQQNLARALALKNPASKPK